MPTRRSILQNRRAATGSISTGRSRRTRLSFACIDKPDGPWRFRAIGPWVGLMPRASCLCAVSTYVSRRASTERSPPESDSGSGVRVKRSGAYGQEGIPLSSQWGRDSNFQTGRKRGGGLLTAMLIGGCRTSRNWGLWWIHSAIAQQSIWSFSRTRLRPLTGVLQRELTIPVMLMAATA